MLYNLKKCFPTYLSGRWDRVNRLLSIGSISGSLLPMGMHTREGVVLACKLPPRHCTVRKMETQRSWVTFSEASSSQASLLKPVLGLRTFSRPESLVWNLTCMISARRDQTEDCMVWGPCKSRPRMKQCLWVRPCLALDTLEEEAPAPEGTGQSLM